MDVYSLTRKKRPSHLTLAQPSRVQSDNDSALDVSLSKTISKTTSRSPSSYIFDEVTGSPSRDHWKVCNKKKIHEVYLINNALLARCRFQ